MSNVVGVVFVCVGLFGVVWGLFGVRPAAVVAGLALFAVSSVLLIDVDQGA